MSSEIQLRQPDALPDLADPFANYDRQGQQPANIFKILHGLLRGRYHWCVLLGLIGLGLGTYGGYKAGVQTYSATGLIQVRAVLPEIFGPTPENRMLPMFEQFQQSQAALIKDLRVVESALQQNEWKQLGRPYSDDLLRDFLAHLNVAVLPRSDLITVSFDDPDPKASSAAVQSVIRVYEKIYIEKAIRDEEQKRSTVEQRRSELTLIVTQLQDQIRQKAGDFATEDNLRSMYGVQVQNVARLQGMLDECAMEMTKFGPRDPAATQPAATQTGVARAASGAATRPAVVKLSSWEVALRDQGMRQLLREEQNLTTELSSRSRTFGPKHPKVLELTDLLTAKKAEIDEYLDQYNKAMELSGAMGTGTGGGNVNELTREELERRRNIYTSMFDKAQAQVTELGKRVADIEALRQKEKRSNDELDLARKRAEDLSTQASLQQSMQGRIVIANYGEKAMLLKDNRISRAAAGGVGGAGLGVGLIVLLSLLDRRFRTPEDVRTSAGRLMLLGVLPSLPEDLADPEQAAIAAHCVHQIRTLLQISAAGSGPRVMAITSPAAGTGKTSLTLALGVSFAAANARTLMIDCDIVGGGLTARVDAIVRRKIGQILLRHSLITQQQLDLAMKMARSTQKRLGEVLVQLGYLTEADVVAALTRQEESPVGLLDALSGDDLASCVADSGIRGLEILPVGAAQTSDVSKLSPSAIHKLLERARETYDMILIDTGPVPGSLEASVVAAAADSVVVVVSRGEHRPMALRSIQHLRDIGARVAGMVFNRAEGRDMDLATTTQRLSSYDRSGHRVVATEGEVVDTVPSQHVRLGPVALAVTGRSSSAKNTSTQQAP